MSAEPEERRVIAQAATPRGELVLTRRGTVTELRVNGVYVMDTGQTSSERVLARAALDRLPAEGGDLRVLVGGLGLGFTVAEVLTDHRVSRVEVVEIEPDLVAWHRAGLVPETAAVLRDRRVIVTTGDIAEFLDADGARAEVDLILLDVDNGPGYLVYDGNEALYRRPFLSRCRRRCRAAGVVAIWSAQRAPELLQALTDSFADAGEVAVPVTLGRRGETYWVYLGFA